MILILWRSGRVIGGVICFFVVLAVFAAPLVWPSTQLGYWYVRLGTVLGLAIVIAAWYFALRK